MADRTREEWDAPHLLPDGIQDPFTMFACNEQKIAWMRGHGYPEPQVLVIRRSMDRALVAYHAHLREVLRSLTGEECLCWRDYVPQVEFWSSPLGLAMNDEGERTHRFYRPRHPVWPMDPGDAPGEAL